MPRATTTGAIIKTISAGMYNYYDLINYETIVKPGKRLVKTYECPVCLDETKTDAAYTECIQCHQII